MKPKELFRSNSDLNLKRPEVPRPKRKVGPPPTRAVHGLHGHVLQPRQKDENQKAARAWGFEWEVIIFQGFSMNFGWFSYVFIWFSSVQSW